MSDIRQVEPVRVRHETLEKIRFTLKEIMLKSFVEAQVDIESHGFWDHVVIELTGTIWGQKLKRHEVKYPRDWWQAVKARWFPRWARRRWPVIYEVKGFEAVALYPEYKSIFPGQHVTVALLDLGTATRIEVEP